MSLKIFISLILLMCSTKHSFGQENWVSTATFNLEKDLLVIQYDCKTDVDDLHSVAAFATLLSRSEYQNLNYHAVAGTYGMQNGLYVPPNELFALAFGKQWSDAHNSYEVALKTIVQLAIKTLNSNGSIWIAEAGQSDFTFDVVKALQLELPNFDNKRIHVVQHSDWNEEVTTPEKLDFVKSSINYHKIPDGNATQNGTPGFRSETLVPWSDSIKEEHLSKVWKLAIKLGNQYNGKDNRYLNQAIEKGGLDFSDFSEVCWILGLTDIEDANAYFEFISEKD